VTRRRIERDENSEKLCWTLNVSVGMGQRADGCSLWCAYA